MDSSTQDSLPLSSSTRVAAGRASVVYRERLKCLALGQAEAIVPLLKPHPTELVSWCHMWNSINLANTVTYLKRSTEALPHPIYRPTQDDFP